MSTLKQAIELQLQHLTKLQLLLETELHLISSRDAEGLMSLLEDKQQTLDLIQQQDQTIEAYHKQAIDKDPNSINDEIQTLYNDAQQLIEQCKFRTSINQKAVEQGQLKLEHLRHLLLETRAKESLTYDRSGKPKGGSLGKGVSA